MNKIVHRHIPATNLPEYLREGIDANSTVTVTVTVEASDSSPERAMSLEEILAARRPPYRTVEEIDTWVRAQRDEWDR
jgi:hypothetical protein